MPSHDTCEPTANLQALLEKYFRLLPQYQGVPLSQLKFRRLLFGGFPCYQDAPLRPQFDRILQVSQHLCRALYAEVKSKDPACEMQCCLVVLSTAFSTWISESDCYVCLRI
jgi:hypothetical protein